MNNLDIENLQRQLKDFSRERDWAQFHTPKNLTMALAGEVGELLAIFQWKTPEESASIMADSRQAAAVQDELADVFCYLLQLAEVLDVDLSRVVTDKMERNEIRYPISKSRGNAIKYTRLNEE